MKQAAIAVIAALFLMSNAPRLFAAVGNDRARVGYAHPEMLVTPAWVAAHRADQDVRIVDMREEKDYASGHIPGAIRIEDEAMLRNPEQRFTYLPKPETFAAMMAKAGIGNGTHVIAYDDQGGRLAARLWYVLNAFGHSRVSLINGGLNKWKAEKRPLTTDVPTVTPAHFVVKETPEMSCDLPQFLARKKNIIVLDARSSEEYNGKVISDSAKRAGHVPGAVNAEWRENVSGPNLEFKSADALRKMYAAKNITPDKRIIVHCSAGGRAAQSLFTLKLLGYPKVKIYYGSFADYSNLPDVPIAK